MLILFYKNNLILCFICVGPSILILCMFVFVLEYFVDFEDF